MSDDPLVAAVARALDPAALRRAVDRVLPRAAAPVTSSPGAPGPVAVEVLERVLLADVLDDNILGARPGDAAYPLRLLFAELGAAIADETAFTLACALNLFFRAEMDEEWKMRVGVEASRLYYRFAASGRLDDKTVKSVSPALAKLLSTELSRVRLEAVDHQSVFDSAVHEREPGSNPASAAIRRPASMLCRVAANAVVRVKAGVVT
ncbi:MAG TPA: hypothetical protein VHB21_17210 [Minicystis sp.]|nr:hypothetical protein [Minicystis sp.]